MFIEWKPEYGTDSPIIDEQHKHLVKIINELHAAIKKRGDINHTYKTYLELIEYTKTHFTQEETLMKNINYPALTEHVEQHTKLKEQVLDLKQKFSTNKKEICVETILFLKNWLTDHIISEDLKYAPYIKKAQ